MQLILFGYKEPSTGNHDYLPKKNPLKLKIIK